MAIDICGQTTTNKKQPKQMLNMLNSLIWAEEQEEGQEIMTSSQVLISNTQILIKSCQRKKCYEEHKLSKDAICNMKALTREKNIFSFLISTGNVFVAVVS